MSKLYINRISKRIIEKDNSTSTFRSYLEGGNKGENAAEE